MDSQVIWTARPTGMGWSHWHSNSSYMIEPEDLDTDHWLLWSPDRSLVFEGTFSDCQDWVADRHKEDSTDD